MSGDILDSIDGAIHDWETGPDAMRWTPEPPEPPVIRWTLVETPFEVPWTDIGYTTLDGIAFDAMRPMQPELTRVPSPAIWIVCTTQEMRARPPLGFGGQR